MENNESKTPMKEEIEEPKVSSKEELVEILDDDTLDYTFPDEVKKLSHQNVYYCYQCGTCVSGCPVTDFGQNTKKLIRKIIFGLRDEVLNDNVIWLCTECYYCAERCPQGVELPVIWITLRNMAAKKGIIPTHIKFAANAIKTTGRVTEVPEAVEIRREKLNLPRVGPVPGDVLKEIDQIFENTDFPMKKRSD